MMKRIDRFTVVALLVCITHAAEAQLWKSSRWERGLKDRYEAHIDVVYGRVDSFDLKLDYYIPKDAVSPRPALVWFHGGGWGRLSKDSVSGQLVPYLEAGWAVFNVDYRLTPQALAPAAVVDCRCALHWIVNRADSFKVDVDRIVLSGTSAGGHLALITGMLPNDTPYDLQCGGRSKGKAAAIVNFYGITDVSDLMDRANKRGYAVKWLGDGPDKEKIARDVSPMSYVREDLPPIFTVHGDQDPTVPYEHAVLLHAALSEKGVANELLTIPGGKHGRFEKHENIRILQAIGAFLQKHNIVQPEFDIRQGLN